MTPFGKCAAAGAVGAAMMAAVSTVFACTSNPALNLSRSVAAAGSVIDVTGSAFVGDPVTGSNVVLHWNGAAGPVLTTAALDPTGGFGPIAVTVPGAASPGDYVLVGTSSTDPERILSRAALTVDGPRERDALGTAGHGTAALSGEPSGSIRALAGAGALALGGLTLIAAGGASLVRVRRVPSSVPMRKG